MGIRAMTLSKALLAVTEGRGRSAVVKRALTHRSRKRTVSCKGEKFIYQSRTIGCYHKGLSVWGHLKGNKKKKIKKYQTLNRRRTGVRER